MGGRLACARRAPRRLYAPPQPEPTIVSTAARTDPSSAAARAPRPAAPRGAWAAALALLVAAAAAACGRAEAPGAAPEERELVVFNAGSLGRPLRAALDTFAARTGVTVHQENAGSLESARKLTELGKIPDVIALADEAVFPTFLMPAHTSWYVRFAHNRMVVAFTPRSRYAAEVGPDSWWRILLRDGVEVGRSDPNLDPNGYRTLLVLQLAERHYGVPGMAERLLAAMPPRNVRPKEADLVGLLQAGELDYIWSYASLAEAAGLQYVRLPGAIDLGDPADSATYARSSVRVTGARAGDTLTIAGRPIVYALSIPNDAPHPALAERFVAFLLSPDGQRVLRDARLDALERPMLVGDGGVPPAVRAATVPVTEASIAARPPAASIATP